MSNIDINDIIDVYLEMVDFCNENGLDIINFSSVDLTEHVVSNSFLAEEIDENDKDGEFEYE